MIVQKLIKYKVYIKIIFIVIITTSLAGCFGGIESDEMAVVLAMGIDKGEKAPIELTVTIASPTAFAGGGNGGGQQAEPFFNTSVQADSIWAAQNLINTYLTREVSLQHVKSLVFGEELAREGIEQYLLAIRRQREARGTVSLYVCRGKAKDFLEKIKPKLEVSAEKYFDLMDKHSETTGLFPNKDINYFYATLKSYKSNPVAPLVGINDEKGKVKESATESLAVPYLAGEVPRTGGSPVEFLGAAVFNKDRVVGYINGHESRTMLLLKNEFYVSTFGYTDPKHEDKYIAVRLRKAKAPDVNITTTSEGLKMHHTIYLEGEFVTIESGENYEDPKKKKLAEEAFDREIEKSARNLIAKTKEKGWGDIFRYDRYYRKELSTWSEWENLNWQEIYDHADITVDFKTVIRRPGLLRQTSPIMR